VASILNPSLICGLFRLKTVIVLVMTKKCALYDL
jgi:hypothetical protein